MKILTTATLIFAGVLAITIGMRIEQQTMAILMGTAVGFLAAAICVGLIAYFVIHRKPAATPQRDQTADARAASYANPNLYSQSDVPHGTMAQLPPAIEYQPRPRGPMGPGLPYASAVYGYIDPRTGQFVQAAVPSPAQHYAAPPYGAAQVYGNAPTYGMPMYGGQMAYPLSQPMPTQRRFTMIGASGQTEEIVPSQEELQPVYEM
ncbi:MAG: hypothetical protein KIH69_003060 [Anaerolineae bacterium]|nr:hypothetical protein [Anaerolineae bacterium]